MKLSITKEEYAYLSDLFRQVQDAQRVFSAAFESSVRARALTQATLVSLAPDSMEVSVPDDALPPDGPKLVA